MRYKGSLAFSSVEKRIQREIIPNMQGETMVWVFLVLYILCTACAVLR